MNLTEQQQEEQTSRHSNLTYLSFGKETLARNYRRRWRSFRDIRLPLK
jgi:hypothetical protein